MATMRIYLRILLDVIFPPTPHERLLRTVLSEDFLVRYQPCVSNTMISLAPYHSRTVQAAVAACKFEKNQHAATLLAGLFVRWLTTHAVSGTTILIPIPLSRAREQHRGFNQVTRVMEAYELPAHYTVKKNWLVRPNDTTRQTSLGRKERLQNMKSAFKVSGRLKETDWADITRIIICDDVMTTGATLEAARTALQSVVPKHVKILCLAWAH